jgi:hypothetical protein
MSFLVVKLDQQLNVLEALELSTHGLATQRAHELIDDGFCARIVDKPLDPVKWFQELKQAPLMLEGDKRVEVTQTDDAEHDISASTSALSLTSRVRLVSHRTPVKAISSRETQILPEKRRVIIRHG